jgi:hypothetical protein
VARSSTKERFQWTEKSVAQGERDGFFLLGCCHRDGVVCERNVERAKENFLIAAELGHVDAMINFEVFLEKTDPQRFVWLGKVAASWSYKPFLCEMEEQMRNFNSGSGRANVVFVIGRALKGHIDIEKQAIFDSNEEFDTRIGPTNQALLFYNFQLESYRKAVDAWTLVGIRCNVMKDIRKMIAKMIWESREDAKYVQEK